MVKHALFNLYHFIFKNRKKKKKKKRNNYQTRLKNLKKIVVDFWFRTSTKLHEEVASYSTKKKRN